MRIRVTGLFILAIIIAGIGTTMFLLLFFKGEELLPKEYVFTPKDAKIETYTEITPKNFKDLFEVKEVLKASVTPTMITVDRMKEVMNKTFVSPLYAGEYLTVHQVSESALVPHEGEIAYPIPDDWWEVIDWTGRIGDVGEIWLTPTEKLRGFYEEKQRNSAQIKGSVSVDPNSNNVANMDLSVDSGEPDVFVVVPELPNRPLSKPFFKDIRVRYVFDSSNKQIRNEEGVDDRSEGTGRPENVKMYLTADEYGKLKAAVEEGYKLILAVDNGVEGQ